MSNLACLIYQQYDLRLHDFPVDCPKAGEVSVSVGAVGICGSDIHYFHEGGIGTSIRVREPIVPGHEFSGVVEALGEGVTRVRIGDRVAINPSFACGDCTFCRQGQSRHCMNMRFMGSAMRFPHTHGGAREHLIAHERQCFRLDPRRSLGEGACSEPLAVGLHACARAGDLRGKTVMVSGCGPIGALTIAAIRYHGAHTIIATDIQDFSLDIAHQMGATRTVNTRSSVNALAEWQEDKGKIDIVFECSGAPSAIDSAISCVRPLGKIVQVGTGGDTPIAINKMVGKEIDWLGTFRFESEFSQAVSAINEGHINVRPVITGAFPLTDALAAFNLATDRTRHSKIQLILRDYC
jgi:L-idonate 5-dehydrogenase